MPRPAALTQAHDRAELLADQLAMAAAGEDSEADREFLGDVEHRDEQKLLGQHAIAEFDAAIGRRDDAADIGVGQHDDQAGAEDGQSGLKAAAAAG